MTRPRYYLALVLQSFGLFRSKKRLADAAHEMDLLYDGEEILGISAWRQAENIEELATEYWTLRRITKAERKFREQLEAAEERLNEAQNYRVGIAQQFEESQEKGENLLLEELGRLKTTREAMIAQATKTKKIYTGLRIKTEVLREESESEEALQECQQRLKEAKTEFAAQREEVRELDDQISKIKKELKQNTAAILAEQEATNIEQKAFAKISSANREISRLKSELGAVLEEQKRLYRTVGRYFNVHGNDPACAEACKKENRLLQQVRALYRSISLNRQLADRG